MFGTMKDLLSGVPVSGRDRVVVPMEMDASRPPRILGPLYTEIMQKLHQVEALQAEVEEVERQSREAAELSSRTLAEAKGTIARAVADLEESQSRWLTITGNLGIVIKETADE